MKLLNFKNNIIGNRDYRRGLFLPVEQHFILQSHIPDGVYDVVAGAGRQLNNIFLFELYRMVLE